MADLVLTAGSVLAVQSDVGAYNPQQGKGAVALTQGIPVYLAADGYRPCDATTLIKATCKGITLNQCEAGQPISLLGDGSNLNLGATLTVGAEYFVSANSGKICPRADLGSGKYIKRLGQATAVDNILLDFGPDGTTVP